MYTTCQHFVLLNHLSSLIIASTYSISYLLVTILPDHVALNFITSILLYTKLMNNFYFYILPRLRNSLLVINTSLPIQQIKRQLKTYFWNHFVKHFNVNNNCTLLSLHYLCPCCKFSCPVNFNPL